MTDRFSSKVLSLSDLFALGFFQPASVQRDFQWTPREADQLLADIAAALAPQEDDETPREDDEPQDLSEEAIEFSDGAAVIASAVQDGAAGGEGAEAGGDPEGGDAAGRGEREGDDAASGLPEELALAPYEAEAPDAEPERLFAGAMILRPAAPGRFEVYDGFQRLTTVTILAAVLRDLLPGDPLQAALGACVAAEDGAPRLSHGAEAEALSRFVHPLGAAKIKRRKQSAPEGPGDRRVFAIQTHLARSLARREPEELRRLARFILEDVLVSAVFIAQDRAARHAFVASNIYGLRLKREDVFKGQIMTLARDAAEEAEIGAAWDEARIAVGDELEPFLIAVDLLTRRRRQAADSLGDLLGELERRAAADALRPWLALFGRYAEAWRLLREHLSYPHGGPLGNHLWRMNFFRWTEWKPLALCWLERQLAMARHDESRAYKRSLYRFAELGRRCVAITLYDFDEAKRRDIFLSAVKLSMRKRPTEPFSAKEEVKPLNFSKKVRSDVRAKLSLPLEDDEIRRTALLWYEASLWGDFAPGVLRSGTVEHVLPEKPELTSQWRRDFPDEEQRYLLGNALGNMSVVSWEANREMGNQDFGAKQLIMARREEYDKFKTASDLRDVPSWTPERITARTEAIAAAFWAELRLPEP